MNVIFYLPRMVGNVEVGRLVERIQDEGSGVEKKKKRNCAWATTRAGS